jgi:hypothetical protein
MEMLLYQIFSGDVGDHLTWLEEARDLDAATVRMEALAHSRPGRYFVYSSEEQKVLVSLDTTPRLE